MPRNIRGFEVITEDDVMIIGVAVKQGDLMICKPKPFRHHDCIWEAVEVLGLDVPITGQQGFYLADGTFLNREVAREYAIINHACTPRHTTDLFSADMW